MQTLTGPFNAVRQGAYQIGEFRVFQDSDGAYAIYWERQATETTTHDVVTSALTGTYPVGDWAAPVPVPGLVNTDDHHEGFPWPAELPDGRHLFFVRGPKVQWSETVPIFDSTWTGSAWGAPAKVLEPELSAAQGAIFMFGLPAVSAGDFGVELFFVYIVQHGSRLDFQIGVMPRL